MDGRGRYAYWRWRDDQKKIPIANIAVANALRRVIIIQLSMFFTTARNHGGYKEDGASVEVSPSGKGCFLWMG